MMEKQHATEDFLLLDRLKQGDTHSFELLFCQYWEPLYAMANRRLFSSEEAQDIVQSLFADVWQRREQLQIKTSIRAYLYTALKYAILDHIRAQTVREKYAYAIQQVVTNSDSATDDTVAYHELERKVNQGINSLPERCRQVFRMRRIEQYSVKEIAGELGISVKTVENQLTKATKVLRLHLREYITVLSVLFCQIQ